MRSGIPVALTTILIAVFSGGIARGDVWLVLPGTSIQDAVDAANPGDTVYIKPGTYNENVVIDKNLTLAGLTLDPNKVLINPGSSDVDGIRVTNDADWAIIKNLRVSGFDEAVGIFVEDIQTITIINVITDANYEGIRINEEDTTPMRPNVQMTSVEAFDNEDDGIDLNGTGDASFHLVVCHDNGDDGIDVHEGQNVTVFWSLFTSNFEHGVEINDCGDVSAYLSDFTFQEDGDGLNIDLAQEIYLALCNFNDNESDGAEIDEAGGVAADGCDFLRNLSDGFDVDDCPVVTASLCDCSGNDDNGIEFDDNTAVHLTKVTANGNGADGFALSGTVDEVVAAWLQGSQNGGDGFDVDTASSVDLSFGKFNENGDDGVDITDVPPDDVIVRFVFPNGNGDKQLTLDELAGD